MKKRNPLAVFLLPFITFGIYSWYWAVKTKGEMNKLGEHIPTAWIWLIPLVGGVYWYWKYSEGAQHVTKEKANAVLVFILLIVLGNIGEAILQTYFTDIAEGSTVASPPAFTPQTPTTDIPPQPPQVPPVTTRSEEHT